MTSLFRILKSYQSLTAYFRSSSHSYWRSFTLSLSLCLCLGCAADIEPVDNTSSTSDTPISSELVIDTTSYEEWTYFDLDLYIDDPSCMESCRGRSVDDLTGWDIALQRFKIMSNGGVSGSGDVEIAIIKDQSYDEVTEAPSSGYEVDQEDSEADEDSDPDYVFNQADPWFEYDFMSHSLSTKNYVYIVRTTEGQYVKISIEDYYNDVGDAGYVDLRLERVVAP